MKREGAFWGWGWHGMGFVLLCCVVSLYLCTSIDSVLRHQAHLQRLEEQRERERQAERERDELERRKRVARQQKLKQQLQVSIGLCMGRIKE